MSNFKSRSDCKLHKKPLDSYCFDHKVVCCLVCHSKLPETCGIVSREQALSRLRNEVSETLKSLNDVTDYVKLKQTVVQERMRILDDYERRTLNDIEDFYKNLREAMNQSQKQTEQSVVDDMTEKRVFLLELEAQINHLDDISESVKATDKELGAAMETQLSNTCEENLQRHVLGLNESLAVGKSIMQNLDGLANDPVTHASEFVGKREDVERIVELVDGLYVTPSSHEGGVKPNNDAIANQKAEDIKFFRKLQQLTVEGHVVALRYISSTELSDLILLTTIPCRMIRLSEDGKVKYSADLPFQTSRVDGFCVKKGIIYIPSPCPPFKIHMYKLSNFCRIKAITTEEACNSVDVISGNLVVCCYWSDCVRLLSDSGEVTAEYKNKTYMYGGFEECLCDKPSDVQVPVSGEGVIVLTCGWTNILILSPDLQKLLKELNCRDLYQEARGMCLQLDTIFTVHRGYYPDLIQNRKPATVRIWEWRTGKSFDWTDNSYDQFYRLAFNCVSGHLMVCVQINEGTQICVYKGLACK